MRVPGEVVRIRIKPRNVAVCIALFEKHMHVKQGTSLAEVISRALDGLCKLALDNELVAEPNAYEYGDLVRKYKGSNTEGSRSMKMKATLKNRAIDLHAEALDVDTAPVFTSAPPKHVSDRARGKLIEYITYLEGCDLVMLDNFTEAKQNDMIRLVADGRYDKWLTQDDLERLAKLEEKFKDKRDLLACVVVV